ncbi:MAG: glycosyltransferase family 2 protein [Patescibacteria group bacterium]
MPMLSVVIPVYNERTTIERLVEAVDAVPLPGMQKEIILVDDGSTDGTRDVIRSFEARFPSLVVVFQEKNSGKGAAIRTGMKRAAGEFCIIQDADLEYDPREYALLLEPLLDGRADVVYGSRFISDRPHRVLFFWHYVGNRFLTLLSNMFTNLNLTDMETCYKAFTRDAVKKILPDLRSDRFTIEPEITARVAKHHMRVYEVGISYSGRTYAEGKKINWKDGVSALWAIIRFNVFS